jgi:hypothetical protein
VSEACGARVVASRVPEEVVELDDVLMARRKVAVPAGELVDEYCGRWSAAP